MSKVAKIVGAYKERSDLVKSLESFKEILQKSTHEDIVAGIKVPSQLKSHDEPVPYEHPHRELASKFVTAVHQKNKFEGARMSEKYLGIGAGGKALHPNALPPEKRKKYAEVEPMDKAVTISPAIVSSPLEIGAHGQSTSEPKIIQSPNIMNVYKCGDSCGPAHQQVSKILSSFKSRPKGK